MLPGDKLTALGLVPAVCNDARTRVCSCARSTSSESSDPDPNPDHSAVATSVCTHACHAPRAVVCDRRCLPREHRLSSRVLWEGHVREGHVDHVRRRRDNEGHKPHQCHHCQRHHTLPMSHWPAEGCRSHADHALAEGHELCARLGGGMLYRSRTTWCVFVHSNKADYSSGPRVLRQLRRGATAAD